MTTLISVLFLGFFLGMRHATDADHVVAVTNFITRQRSIRGALGIGGLWGLGHSLAIGVVGGAIVVFGWVIPPQVGLSFEFAVAIMLIVLGVMNLEQLTHWLGCRWQRPAAAMSGAVASASGPHPGPGNSLHQWLDSRAGRWPHVLRPLAVGLVHGLAGSAALALLVLALIHNAAWGMAYLVMFGVGSIAGMMAITAAIAWPCARVAGKSARFRRRLCDAAGSLSIALGLFLAYRVGFVEGLFLL